MFGYSRKEVKAWAKSRIPLIWGRRYAITTLVAVLFLLFIFRDFVGMVLVMAAFIALGVTSMMYNRWVKVSLGFELIMLGIVITTAIYGRVPGFIVGAVALFFSEVLTDRFTYSTFVSFIGILGVVVIVPILGDISIVWKGIWSTVVYDLVIGPGYLVMGSSPWRTLLFVATHLLFNVWVFAFIAPFLFRMLA